ncbi:non-hydrolyzing UDP-N-acetylglucosamine 2-epimerase [Sedimenticola selenatireducens]|uniref:UDP-N-acetylglucosamine 2-epimerase (Non-hydrolyzing) n=1 Tax=Sedimenticola selenatireducens TaxID=191960 RepID=A0A557S4T5_9GAMM|nr:UDP-N-acetylglucosamine 2-epimerase (non-hydrolyzing) [Sedimenticola selenatireducens]TVO72424.1 UDP-N-acetylglucosamine 2-epimerase (non-hydrolyzing) [Sedimenticola selenatireducens]TVT64679.1 MAG: UDP-N-acetylglucosamine 2-epimerase (non-hydrolyzing) [Sedimenticola selenatireducens]
MKIVTIVGARPQFIKAAAISRVIREDYTGVLEEVIVHTGQHFDENMSKVFFEELDIPHPRYNLEISGGQHGAMTGRMLEAIEKVLLDESPDLVLIYGDTNSTLAGALSAAKLHIPVAHVEAGLRSYNMRMPEEVNRIVADRLSAMLFCPTETAAENLKSEGITAGVFNVGDVMFDVAQFYRHQARKQSAILQELGLNERGFALATCHRAENTDSLERLTAIVTALGELAHTIPVVMPLHPRTRNLISDHGLAEALGEVKITEPLAFLDMVVLEQAAQMILTDSGGVQKEAFFYGVPCITMRDETEWGETVELGWNRLVGASASAITAAANSFLTARPEPTSVEPYGQGDAANKIVAALVEQGLIN